MNNLIRRLITLLFKLKFYKQHYTITYSGPITSMNKIWSGGHWAARQAAKDKYSKIFDTLLKEAKAQRMEKVTLVLLFNSRCDVDNVIVGCKVLMDVVKTKYLKDDTKKYYDSLIHVYDENLPKDTYEYHLLGR